MFSSSFITFKKESNNSLLTFFLFIVSPPGMRRRSDILFRSHISRDVADHAEASSRRRNWYVNEADLFEMSLRRLIGT